MIDTRAGMHLRLMQQRDQLLREAEALKNKIAGLDMAIGLIGENAAPQPAASDVRPKVHVSETIVALLREAGEAGLKAKATIELAAGRGIDLNRGSVYALLNRMNRNGTVVQEDARYKLMEFAGRREGMSLFVTPEPAHAAGKY